MANNGILGAMLLLIRSKADVSGITKTDKALRKTGTTAKIVSKEMGLISKLTGGAFAMLAVRKAGQMFASYLQFEKDLGAMKSRFYAITKNEAMADEEFEYIRKLATDTALDIKSTADSYSIFYASAQRSLGKEGARGIFETWTKISRVLHLSEAQFERVTYALREMSSKGQLYSQDLKIQLGTHVPDAVNIAQEAIKNLGIDGVKTVEDFQKHTKANPLTGNILMARFIKEFTRVAGTRFASPEALAKALKQPDALEQSIKNIGQNFLTEFSKRGGNQAIINILNGLKDALMSIDYVFLSKVFAKLFEGASMVFKVLPQILWILQKIAIFMTLYYGMKGIGKLYINSIIGWNTGIKTFRKIIKGFHGSVPLVTKFMYSLGRAFPFMSKFASFIARFGFRGSLKYILSGILGVSGPLGWLAGALMWLPEIFSIIKWISKKMGWKDETKLIGEYVGDTGIKTSTALNVIRALNKRGIKSGAEAYRQLGYYGASELIKYISWDSHDQIVLRLENGEFIDEEKLAEALLKKVNANNLDENKPNVPRPIISKKGAYNRGY